MTDFTADNQGIFRLANKVSSPPKSALLTYKIQRSPFQLGCIFFTIFTNNIDSIIIKIKNHKPTINYPSSILA